MSMTSVTSAMPIALRDDEPAKITSSARRVRSVRPCSPSVQRSASARLLLPLPLGPDHGADARPELDDRLLGERLEADEAQRGQARGIGLRPRSGLRPCCARSRRSRLHRSDSRLLKRSAPLVTQRQWQPEYASRAASVSASRRLRPSPWPRAVAADRDLDDVVARVRRPLVADQPVLRRAAGACVAQLLEHALGRLERLDLRFLVQLRLRPRRAANRACASRPYSR